MQFSYGQPSWASHALWLIVRTHVPKKLDVSPYRSSIIQPSLSTLCLLLSGNLQGYSLHIPPLMSQNLQELNFAQHFSVPVKSTWNWPMSWPTAWPNKGETDRWFDCINLIFLGKQAKNERKKRECVDVSPWIPCCTLWAGFLWYNKAQEAPRPLLSSIVSVTYSVN